MNSLARLLEYDLATTNVPELAKARRERLQSIPSTLKRLGGVTVHSFTQWQPERATNILNRLIGDDLEYVGAGADFSVYRQGDLAIKVHRESINLNEDDRYALAKRLQAENDLLQRGFGNFVISQDVTIADHPADPSLRAVQIHQPYRMLRSTGIFSTNNPDINNDSLTAVLQSVPNISARLAEFVERASLLHHQDQYLPDTNGHDNVVLVGKDSNELCLIDGQPISDAYPDLQSLISHQLESLSTAIAQAA